MGRILVAEDDPPLRQLLNAVLAGTQSMMRKGSGAITPGVARIQVLPAIEPS